jgi:hypothetical protein
MRRSRTNLASVALDMRVTLTVSLKLSATGLTTPLIDCLTPLQLLSVPVADMATLVRFTGAPRACAGEHIGSNREA